VPVGVREENRWVKSTVFLRDRAKLLMPFFAKRWVEKTIIGVPEEIDLSELSHGPTTRDLLP
jgi:hypothetical protein